MPGSEFLRQRRSQILQDKKKDELVKGVIKKTIVGSQNSSHILKIFLVVITALLCTVGSLLRYSNPKILKRFWTKPIPTFQLATRYPTNMVLERDLPRFFRQLSIATPDNAMAREAVQKVLRNRNQLRKRAGRIKSSVKAWDDSNVELLLNQRICGDDFMVAYRSASKQKKDDLLMWCLIASRITEGFFKESLEMVDSPLFLTRNRGIVIKRQPTAGVADGYGELSTSFYLHPRFNNSAAIDWIPSKILETLVSSSGQELDVDGQEVIERMLYELVVAQENENEFLILEEICQENRPERSIAFETSNNADRCFFVVPEKYGGNFDPRDDE
jgi:hypothetical protein